MLLKYGSVLRYNNLSLARVRRSLLLHRGFVGSKPNYRLYDKIRNQRLGESEARVVNSEKLSYASILGSNDIKSMNLKMQVAIDKEDFATVWETCQLMKKAAVTPNIETYRKLLSLCRTQRNKSYIDLATELYLAYLDNRNVKGTLRSLSHDRITPYFMQALLNSRKFTDYFLLNHIWINEIEPYASGSHLRSLYFSTSITILLNSNQFEMAYDVLRQALDDIDAYDPDNMEASKLFNNLPFERIMGVLNDRGDCDTLNEMLHILWVYKSNRKSSTKIDKFLKSERMMDYLNTALAHNHYELVKSIYYNYIMAHFDTERVSDTIIHKKKDQLENDETLPFYMVNGNLTYQILHTFATNGDVNLVLSLVEAHYLHKPLKGQKGITKDIIIKIIEAYCYNRDLMQGESTFEKAESKINDDSIKKILEVITSCSGKLPKEASKLRFLDITQCMSFKFMNYQVIDKNIQREKERRSQLEDANISGARHTNKNTPISNKKLENSDQGNIMFNLDVLATFVREHVCYIEDREEISQNTLTLFINCILNHVNLYQTFSGTVRVLSVLNSLNSKFWDEWLDHDLIKIILNSMANSSGAKICSLLLFHYLTKTSKMEPSYYRFFISASLRGNFHDLFQFYMYHYMQACGHELDNRTILMLEDIPTEAIKENEKSLRIVYLAKEAFSSYNRMRPLMNKEEISTILESLHIGVDTPVIKNENLESLNRKYLYHIDARDSEYLKYMISV